MIRKRAGLLTVALFMVVAVLVCGIGDFINATNSDKPVEHFYSDYFSGYALSNSKATKPIQAFYFPDEKTVQVRDSITFKNLFEYFLKVD